MEEPASALEQFRQQWRQEVSARAKQKSPLAPLESRGEKLQNQGRESRPVQPQKRPPAAQLITERKDHSDDDSVDEGASRLIERIEGLTVQDIDSDDFSAKGSTREPKSALEHYERAVEKESQGNLGDSLSHYRQAYRLDARVEQSYKGKHFPPKSKPANLNPSNASATVPSTAHHSSKEPSATLTGSELIASFRDLPIPGAPPMIEGDRPPPCPLSKLPSEVLLQILTQAAIKDPALFARLGMVCKALAYHVCTENQIWKRVVFGSEFGLASQCYDFATDVRGRESIDQKLEAEGSGYTVSESLFPVPQTQDWREVFHSHPRIRFTGVYISTVNYTRPGGASASQLTWNSPVHIVTYYRYLRFFRDGTCISLLTTSEPIEVVHHLTKENMDLFRSNSKDHHQLNFTSSAAPIQGAPGQTVPATAQSLLKHALRGRWRLCHPSSPEHSTTAPANLASSEGDLHIETEGAGPRYMYTMHLSLKSSSARAHAPKNTKLVWKGFWSYNQLTSDWAEFQLKNDKAFLFSRVRSYGLGY